MEGAADSPGRQSQGMGESYKKLPTFGVRVCSADDLRPEVSFLQQRLPVEGGSMHQVNA